MLTLTDVIKWITENWDNLSGKQKDYLCKMLTERKEDKRYIFEKQISVEDCFDQGIDSTDVEILINYFEGDGI